MKKLSLENQLLLYCCQPNISDEISEEVKNLLLHPLDWQTVLQAAHWHFIVPLLYQSMEKMEVTGHIPERVLALFQKNYNRNIARNMLHFAELKIILSEFHAKGVDIVVLKGGALAELVYKNIGVRNFNDIDLLVREEHLDRAEEIMTSLGYEAYGDRKLQEMHRKRLNHLAPFIHKKKSVEVEIHSHIIKSPFYVDIHDLWQRAQKVTIAEVPAFILSPEDMIIHFCLHLVGHSPDLMPLRGFCDISWLIDRYDIDWKLLRRETERYGMQQGVYPILFLIKKYFPHDSLYWLSPEFIDRSMVCLLERRTFTVGHIDEYVYFSLKTGTKRSLSKSGSEKLKILVDGLVLKRKELAHLYMVPRSSVRIYWYYFYYFYRLMIEYGKLLFGVGQRAIEDSHGA